MQDAGKYDEKARSHKGKMMHKHRTNLWLCALAAMSAVHAQEKMLSEVTVSSTVSDLEERRRR